MSFRSLLTDSCVIQTRTVVTSGMRDTETWADQPTATPCRKITRNTIKGNVEKTQYSTVVQARFVVPLSAVVSLRDRISHGGRVYDIAEIIVPHDRRGAFHQIVVCEAVAGGV